jgi:iron only hydrogenase large subunit-like protein
MVIGPPVATDLVLTDEEMNDIYLEMRNIDISKYPEKYYP